MGRKVNRAILMALVTIEYTEQRIASHALVMEGFQHGGRYGSKEALHNASTVIHMELYRQLNEAYRQLMMMAGLGTTEQQANVRRQAQHRFLRKGMGIMSNLGLYGETPGRWRCADEDEFRKEIEEALSSEDMDGYVDDHLGKEARIRKMAMLRRELKARCGEEGTEDDDSG